MADEDAGAGNITTRVQVTAGVLDVTLSGAASISGGANSSNDLTIQGTVTDVNGTLASLLYTGNTDITGIAADTLTITTNDGGNTGTGGPQQDLDTVQIDITAVNDDPTNAGSMPSDIAVTVDVPSNVDLSAIDLSDVDAGSGDLTVTLTTSTGGNLSASSGGGVTVVGSATGTLSLTGTLTDLNTFLDTASNITYLHPTPGFSGNDADTIQVDVTDNGNTGSGGGGPLNLGTPNVDIAEVNEPTIVEMRVASSTDDAEERASGSMKLTSSDLELVLDSSDQTIGLRFNGLNVPQGAVIHKAYIQFQVDEAHPGAKTLRIEGEDIDNAQTFTSTNGDITSRPRTEAAVEWSPPAWTTVGQAGLDQRSEDVTPIIKEIVDRPGWTSGNSMVLIITGVAGTGKHVAESYDGVLSAAPLLHVEWVLASGSPTTNFTLSGTQVVENVAPGTVVGTFGNVVDPDVGDIHTFSLLDDAGGRFLIVGNVLQVADGSLLDYETAISHDITVRVTDSGGQVFDKNFAIMVDDVNEAPYLVAPIADTFAVHDQVFSLSVSANFADDDTGNAPPDVLTFSGALPNWLTIDPQTGVLSGTPKAGDPDTDVTVTANDLAGLSVSDTFSLSVVAEPPPTSLRFAAFGDYGNDGPDELAVANLVNGFDPDLIVTTGDNSYTSGVRPGPIDDNVGQYYSDYIGNYTGAYGPGSPVNRFFPSIGNHDDNQGDLSVYLDYFTLPGVGTNTSGNERYYDFVQGPVHFFALNSISEEPDGNSNTSIQAQWLQTQLASSTSPWNIVYMHHSPYSSSSNHGSSSTRQWDFEDWGATAVLSAHDHLYERILRNDNGDNFDLPYFVTGLGGAGAYNFSSTLVEGSSAQYNAAHGALIVDATATNITFAFHSVENGGTQIDSYMIERGTVGNDVLLGSAGDDQIDGGAGDDQIGGAGGTDRLIGGTGDDLFVFTQGLGNDTIADFTPGANTDDVIDLSSFSNITTFADVATRSTQVGNDTIIDLGGGDTVTLAGVSLQALHEHDFDLV